jgi:ApaG protein
MVQYRTASQGIAVTVRPLYLDHESDFFERRFVFGYIITIDNESDGDVQLLRRHWRIWDDEGKVQEVNGDGVVGQQPLLEPGTSHQYSSYCVLESLSGAMEGYFTMERFNGERFRAHTPRFHLNAHAN